MFKKILLSVKTQPELANQITASASALPSTTTIPPRMVRSKRKKKAEGDWIRQPEEPSTADQLIGLPSQYKVLNDLLVTNPKSRSGYSQIDHVVIGPRAIFVIETRNLRQVRFAAEEERPIGRSQQPGQNVQSTYAASCTCGSHSCTPRRLQKSTSCLHGDLHQPLPHQC